MANIVSLVKTTYTQKTIRSITLLFIGENAMAEILLCSQPMHADILENQCGISTEDIFGLNLNHTTPTLTPFKPYLLGQNPSTHDQCILGTLGSPSTALSLIELSQTIGADNLHAVAEIHSKLHEAKIHLDPVELSKGMVERTAGVIERHVENLQEAAVEYQKRLLELQQAKKADTRARALARQKAKIAFDKMQQHFRKEVKLVNGRKKVTPLNNFKRATNIATSSRNVAKLEVANQVEASKLAKLAKGAKVVGNVITVLDFGERVNKISTSYKEGGKWEREMFVESSSFATSAIIGEGVAEVGLLLLMATPVGWVGLIVGGVVIAGTAAAAAYGSNELIHENAGSTYDEIMKWIGG